MGEKVNILFHFYKDGLYEISLKESWSGRTVSGRFVPPYSNRQLKELHKRLANQESSNHELRDVGSRLFSALCGFDTTSPKWSEPEDLSVQGIFRNSIRRLVRRRETVALIFHFGSGCDEIARYPWELLHNGDDFLLASGVLTLSRVFMQPDSPISYRLPVHPPFRILYSAPSHVNTVPLEVQHSFEAMQQALAPLINGGQICLDWLESPTFSQLVRYLNESGRAERLGDDAATIPCYAIHFAGRYVYGRLCPLEKCKTFNDPKPRKCSQCGTSLSRVNPQAYLCFCNDQGLHDFIDIQSLRALLLNSGVRLVVFAAYEMAMVTEEQTPFSSYFANRVAFDPTLVTIQVPAIITMPLSPQNDLGPTFMYHFYKSLADGYILEDALSQARQALLSIQQKSWFIPLLYRYAAQGQEIPVPLIAINDTSENHAYPLAYHAPPIAFVGRKQELQDLDELLTVVASDPQEPSFSDRSCSKERQIRHIVLTGLPGIGKSTLASEVIRRNRDKFSGGIIRVSLQNGKSFGDALSEVLRLLCLSLPNFVTMDISQRASLVQNTLCSLASRELNFLLFLDGFEEVQDQAELDMWLQFLYALPQEVVVIVTAHVNPDNVIVVGEKHSRWYEYRVRKMTDADLLALFTVLVDKSGSDQHLDDPIQQGILREICALLDGSPLGVKLVFCIANSMNGNISRPGAVLHFLEEVRDELRNTPLASMLAVLEIAYRHLMPLARLLLAYLSAFKLPFNREQITHLVASMPFFTVQEAISVAGEEVAISELLLENWCEGRDELVRASFIQFDGLVYTIHSQVRHFALVHLSLEEQHRIHRLIAAYYRNLLWPRVEELVAAFDHLETAREVQDLLEAIRNVLHAEQDFEEHNQDSSRANSLVLPVVAQQSEVAKTKHDLLVSNDSRHFLTQQFGELELEADEVQKHAAWSLYVELTTRVATQALSPEQGTLREALNSLYTLYAGIRKILHDAGPQAGAKGEQSFSFLAIQLLNECIRPFNTKWHQLLLVYEKRRPAEVSEYEYELQWENIKEMRAELAKLQEDLQVYVEALAEMAGVRQINTSNSTRKKTLP